MKKMDCRIIITVVSFVVLTFLELACTTTSSSSSVDVLEKNRYDELQKLINDSEIAIKQIYDYEIKMEICEKVISSIYEFIEVAKDEKLIASTKEQQSLWYNRASEYYETLDNLMDVLDNEMKRRVIELANARRSNARYESMELLDYDISKLSNSIFVMQKYQVLTRGTILGIIGNYDRIVVRGVIDMRTNKTEILEVKVE